MRLLTALSVAITLLLVAHADAWGLRWRQTCPECVGSVYPEPAWYGWGAAAPGAVIVPAIPPCQLHAPYSVVTPPPLATERDTRRDKNEKNDDKEKAPAKKGL